MLIKKNIYTIINKSSSFQGQLNKSPIYTYIIEQYKRHLPTADVYCRERNELEYLAETYACLLQNSRKLNVINRIWGSVLEIKNNWIANIYLFSFLHLYISLLNIHTYIFIHITIVITNHIDSIWDRTTGANSVVWKSQQILLAFKCPNSSKNDPSYSLLKLFFELTTI